MNITATLTSQPEEVKEYGFKVTVDGTDYHVKIWVNGKGKFVDESITHVSGEELEHEGTEGEIREKVIDYLDKQWNTLVQ